jgi:hypothetical protein
MSCAAVRAQLGVRRAAPVGQFLQAAEDIAQGGEHLSRRVLDERQRSGRKQDHGDQDCEPAADQRVEEPLRAGRRSRHGDHQDCGGGGLVDEQHSRAEEPAADSQRRNERDQHGEPITTAPELPGLPTVGSGPAGRRHPKVDHEVGFPPAAQAEELT